MQRILKPNLVKIKIKKPAWEQASPYKPYHYENWYKDTVASEIHKFFFAVSTAM